MKWTIKMLFILCLPLMAFTCDETIEEGPNCHKTLHFINATDYEIIVHIVDYYRQTPIKDITLSEESYEDMKSGRVRWNYFIKPQETKIIYDADYYGCLERNLDDCDFLIYVLDAETVALCTPEELSDGRAILEKRLYTLADINKVGTTLVYE